MPQTDFNIVNLGRAFPFQDYDDDATFPLVSDARVTIRPLVGYVHGRDSVDMYLYGELDLAQAVALSAAAGPFVALRTTASPAADTIIMFNALPSAATLQEVNGVTYDKTAFDAALTSYSVTTPTDSPYIEGWMTFGEAAEFPEGRHTLDVKLEPTCVFATPEAGSEIGRTFFYNQRLTKYAPPAGCEHTEPVVAGLEEHELVCGPTSGVVDVIGGQSVSTRQDADSSSITFTAQVGRGEAVDVCDNITLTDLLVDVDTAPKCSEVLRQLNGVVGPSLNFTSLRGVSVEPHPEFNRVVINIHGDGLATCLDKDAPAETTPSPANGGGVLCGENGQPAPYPGAPNARTGFAGTNSSTWCTWKANGTGWDLIYYPCKSPLGCTVPDRPPNTPDEELQMPCLLVALDDDSQLRNGDFTATVPLSGWDVTGDVQVVDSYGPLPTAPFPLAKLVESSSIRQNNISVTGSFYTVQLEAYATAGIIDVTFTDAVDDSVVFTDQFSLSGIELDLLVITPIAFGTPLVNLEIKYTGPTGTEALIGFLALAKV